MPIIDHIERRHEPRRLLTVIAAEQNAQATAGGTRSLVMMLALEHRYRQ